MFLSTQAARERLEASARSVARQTLDVMLPRLRPARCWTVSGEAFVGRWARDPRSVGRSAPAARIWPGAWPPCCHRAPTSGALLACVSPGTRDCAGAPGPPSAILLRYRFPDLNAIRGGRDPCLAAYLSAPARGGCCVLSAAVQQPARAAPDGCATDARGHGARGLHHPVHPRVLGPLTPDPRGLPL